MRASHFIVSRYGPIIDVNNMSLITRGHARNMRTTTTVDEIEKLVKLVHVDIKSKNWFPYRMGPESVTISIYDILSG